MAQQRHGMAKAIGKEPADVGHHRRQQIVAAFQPPAAEAQNRDGEVGVGHLVLKGAIGPTDQFGENAPKKKW